MEEQKEFLMRMKREENIGEIFEKAKNFTLDPQKSQEDIIEYLKTTIVFFYHNEIKAKFIWLIKEHILYTKGRPQHHCIALEEVGKWLSKQSILYKNPNFELPFPITRSFTPEQQDRLYKGLKEMNLLLEPSDFDSFCHIFGYKTPKNGFQCLVWKKRRKQPLLDLLDSVISPEIKKTERDKLVPHLFIDTEGNPIELANNKDVGSAERDSLKKLIGEIFFWKK